jgi:hypothetical protein
MSYKSRKLKRINTNNMPGAIRALGNLKYRIILEGIMVGLLVGVVISLFRYSLSQLDVLRNLIVGLTDAESGSPLAWFSEHQWIGFVLLGVFAFLVSYFVYKEPYISGSGIPQIKGELMGKIHTNWLRVLLLKFFGGIMAIGSGLALGREGPSIQLGGMVGKGFSRFSGRLKSEERMLISAGSGAGLFGNCKNLKKVNVPNCSIKGASHVTKDCDVLEELYVGKIYENFQVGSGTSWGHLIKVECLVGLIQNLVTSTTAKTLTIGTANMEKIAGLYCRIIDDTTDTLTMELCEPTDEGAMTLEEYALEKRWQLA